MNEEKISVQQFSTLVLVFTIGSSILVAPSLVIQSAKQNGWVSSILGMGIGVLLILLYVALMNRYPQMTLVDLTEKILGRFLGKLISLLFISYFFILTVVLIREIGDFLTTQILTTTPIEWIFMIFSITVIVGTRLGVETFTRASEIFFPWILFLFIVLIILVIPQMHITNLQPFTAIGIKQILKGTAPMIGLPYLELVTLMMIGPNVNESKQLGKAFLRGVIFGGISLIVITITTLLVFGPELTSLQLYPSYSLAQRINIGNFLQRVEVVMMGIWILTIYFKVTVCFYASTIGIAKVFKCKEYHFLTIPLGMILVLLAESVSPNTIFLNNFLAQMWTPYSFVFGFIFPVILLLTDYCRSFFKRG